MARAATTTDAFNAVAEPRRRQILDVLAGGERSVNELVEALGIAQPQVSKHLRVLLEVGLVAVREEGRRRMYRLEARPLESIHEWVKGYERMWNARFDRLDEVLEQMAKEENDGSPRRAAKEENDGSPRRAAGNEKEEGHGGSNQ
ncbi:MAG TPA: metalloregulator ArsR/SmtB family transcription factor [Actinomycetota bacterium]|nr:metalloregulator ArsR/SmtB family transcription factor [Actinomycetota bacterium]